MRVVRRAAMGQVSDRLFVDQCGCPTLAASLLLPLGWEGQNHLIETRHGSPPRVGTKKRSEHEIQDQFDLSATSMDWSICSETSFTAPGE